MSAAPTVLPARGGTIGLRSAVAAELVRARHSASSRFAAVGLGVSVLQGLGWWLVATSPMRDWFGLFGWQSLYATALLAPLVALLAASTVARESGAREGGTWARPLSPRTGLIARVLVLAWQNLLLQAALTLPMLLFGLAGGLTDPPVGRFVTLWVVQWATSLLPLVLGFLLARRIGMIATVALAVTWQLVGTIAAERASWWAQPWTWGVRAVIPVLGIHQNAVRLEPGAPQWQWSPWWPTLAGLALTVVVVALAAARATVTSSRRASGVRRPRRHVVPQVDAPTGAAVSSSEGSAVAAPGDEAVVAAASPRRTRHGVPAAPVTRGPARLLAAQWTVLRRTAVPPLLGLSLVAVVAVGLVWNAAYVTGFATWLLVPFGASVLGALSWAANADGWRVAALRAPIGRLAGAMLLTDAGILAGVVAVTTLVAGLSRGPGVAPAFPVLLFLVGLLTLTLSLWLSTRFGTGAALGVTLVLLVVSLVVGGSWFSETGLWVVGVLAWPLTADTPGRFSVAVPGALLLLSSTSLAWRSALRRAATA